MPICFFGIIVLANEHGYWAHSRPLAGDIITLVSSASFAIYAVAREESSGGVRRNLSKHICLRLHRHPDIASRCGSGNSSRLKKRRLVWLGDYLVHGGV